MMKAELLDYMGTDLDVVDAARVSFDKQSEWEEWWDVHKKMFRPGLSARDKGLIRYLAEKNHWSPFAHVIGKFRVKAPIFVARQLAKHQVGFAWNEVSRRYVDSEPEFYTPEKWRRRADNVKQGSSDDEVYCIDTFDEKGSACWDTPKDWYAEAVMYAEAKYREALRSGVCPEQARMVLPQSMMTEWIWTGSLFGWARVYNQRTHDHAQAECMPIAKAIGDELRQLFPVSWDALTVKLEG